MNHHQAHTLQAGAPLPVRLRNWVALFAIFVGLAAQAIHTHPVSAHGAAAGFHALEAAAQSADLCPLCVAMHTSEPAAASGVVSIQFSCSAVLLPEMQRAQAPPPSFAQFCRPPPSSTR